MQKICPQCSTQFKITEDDLKFYEKVSPIFREKKFLIPAPTLCPDCRQQRRLVWRNERKLYNRKCDLCHHEIISIYPAETKTPIYCQTCWWGEKWDPYAYGKTFDFSRSFFEQFKELNALVPHISMINNKPENSEYCNQTTGMKNSYLSVNAIWSEDSYYCKGLSKCKNVVDCLRIYDCELCYSCIDCHRCYNGVFLQDCTNCTDCSLCYDCISCQDCFGCAGLRNKQYYVFNEPHTKEQYHKKVRDIKQQYPFEQWKQFFSKIKMRFPHKFANLKKCENCIGDSIHESKDTYDSYDVVGCEHVRFGYDLRAFNSNSYDIASIGDNIEFSYETISSGINMQHGLFLSNCWDGVNNVFYSDFCVHNCSELFGCAGLRHRKYSILNKQYTKKEYEELVPKIIEHMMKTPYEEWPAIRSPSEEGVDKQSSPSFVKATEGILRSGVEWGEFFPSSLSPFGYNETLAQEYFPLTKNQALAFGSTWKEEDISNHYQGPKVVVPEKISEVMDEITKQILTCETCSKNYKIIVQELRFYRNMDVPIPRSCHNCRHIERLHLRNPRTLWNRTCMKCNAPIKTSYSPNRKEIVYCEACYLKEVY